jgi:hypothetical protein
LEKKLNWIERKCYFVIKSRNNCKNRKKIAKIARNLMQKIAKKTRKSRQIVENGVDQVDLVAVGDFRKRKKEKK